MLFGTADVTKTLTFWKLESIGNDFPLVHLEDCGDLPLDQLAIAMADRRFGVGGDGLLVLERSEPLRLRMFNPDGSEDFCGNGIRCASLHAHQLGWVGLSFEIIHGDQIVSVSITDTGAVSSKMAGALYRPDCVPLRLGAHEIFDAPVYWDEHEKVMGSALTTGSTHVVVPVLELPDEEEILRLGPKIEHFELYPIRTSVIWTREVSPDHLQIRIWERGAGETLGCGTGSSAAAADYLRRQGKGGRVRVDNPGGSVFVEASSWSAPILVEGRAESVFEGEFLLPANLLV